jgi:hypothetical protein
MIPPLRPLVIPNGRGFLLHPASLRPQAVDRPARRA